MAEDDLSMQGTQECSLVAIMTRLSEIDKKQTEVLGKIASVEKSLSEQSSKGNAMMSKMKNQTKTIEAMEKSLNELSTKYDEVLAMLKSHEIAMKELKKKSDELETRMEARNLEIQGNKNFTK